MNTECRPIADATDAEIALLGSLLIAGDEHDTRRRHLIEAVTETGLTEADFGMPKHATIYIAAMGLHGESGTIDIVRLADRLKNAGQLEHIGGSDYLIHLADNVPIAENAPHYARLVREGAAKRWIASQAHKLDHAAGNGTDALDALQDFAAMAREAEELATSIAGKAAQSIVRMADVKPEPIHWLWPSRIAMGKLTMLVGDPGLGKSFATIDLASRVSTGAGWPDRPGERMEPGGAVFLSAEDDVADTIRPRLDAAGADSNRIAAIREPSFCLARDLPTIERAIESVENCRLVVVDPVSAYLGQVDSHKNTEVRAALSPLAELAAKHRVALVVVSHLNKGAGSAIYRVTGSLAFVAAARTAWLVTRDKDNEARRLMLPIKNNIGTDRSGLAFSLRAANATAAIAWEAEPVTLTADEALDALRPQMGRPSEDRDEAERFLRDALGNGPRPSKDVEEEWEDGEGGSASTLKRARKSLGVQAYRPENPGPWWWRMPS